MKKIMLALSFLSIGGVIRAAELTAAQKDAINATIRRAEEARQRAEEAKQRQAQERQAQRQKQIGAASLTVAALIAAATTYVTHRAYQNRKKLLVKEYNLGNLNNLEDKLWLATIIARYGISWRLRALISNNPAAVAKLSNSFLNALAELYYGKKPSQLQMSQFMQRFFPGRK